MTVDLLRKISHERLNWGLDVTVKQDLRDYTRAKSDRTTLDTQLEEITRIMAPRLRGSSSSLGDGGRRNDEIFDGTPMTAARSLANTIVSMLFPDDFFTVRTENDIESTDRDSMIWVQEATKIQRRIMNNPRARFSQTMSESCFTMTIEGTGPLFMGLNNAKNGMIYRSVLLKDAFIMGDLNHNINGMFRREVASARDWYMHFNEKPGPAVKHAMDIGDFHTKFEYVHVVRPRKDGVHNALLAKNRPFTSNYIEVESETSVLFGGFNRFPYVVPRWDTSAGELYGRSPGMIALPDSLTLQAMSETILEAGQRSANPPLLMPNEGTFDIPNAVPGGIIEYDAELAREMGKVPVAPLNTGANLAISRDMQRDVREQVANAFFRNVFNLPANGPQMTATEVVARTKELLRQTGSVFGNLGSELVSKVSEGTFEILLEAGAFPPIPPALQGQNIKFSYKSPLSKARDEIKSSVIQRTIEEIAQIAQMTGDPGVFDNIDLDYAVREKIRAHDIAEAFLIPEELVIQKRVAKAKIQQQAAKDAQIAQTVGVAKDAAGAAKSLNGAPDIMAALTGQQPQQQASGGRP